MRNFVYKPKRTVKGVVQTARMYRGRYQLAGGSKLIEVALKTTDKRVAEQKLAEIIRIAEQQHAGIIPKQIVIDSAQKPLQDHLEDMIVEFKSRNLTDNYIKKTKQRVTAIANDQGWQYPIDVTAESFLNWRAKQTTLVPKTLNQYYSAIHGLLEWLMKLGKIQRNPLAIGVDWLSTDGKETFERRAFTNIEITNLINVSEKRKAIYLFAVHTGYRHGELGALIWDDIHFADDDTYVKLRAKTTKNKKDEVKKLKPELVVELLKIKPKACDPKDKVFSGGMPTRHTFKRDLKSAGIEVWDDTGRKVDFHALRHTFITNAQKTGLPSRTIQEAARHLTPELTNKVYTDTSKLETNQVIDALPSFLISECGQANIQKYTPIDPLKKQNGPFDTLIDPLNKVLNRHKEAPLVTEKQIEKVEGCLKIADIDPELALIVTTCLRLAGGWTTNEKWRRGESNSRE